MKHCVVTCALAALGIVTVTVTASAGQAGAIPLGISVTASPAEIGAGDSTTIAVHLKNYRGDKVSAPEDLTVTLHSEVSGDATLVFKAGQSDAQTQVRFYRPGLATIVASGPNLTSGTASVVVRTGTDVAPAASPSAGVAAQPTSTASARKIGLAVDVLPEHVHASNASWQAKVLVTAIDENRQPIAVQTNTSIQLATDVGLVTPGFATIEAGHARTTDPIQLASNRPGAGTVWAWTDTGELGQAAFEDHEAVPAQLAVKALPTRTLNDGRTAVHISIFLQDDTSVATKAEDNVQLQLTSSIGTLSPSTLLIGKGQFVAESILTSTAAGSAEITAMAAGLRPGVATVAFVFPYALVLMAALGGLVGSLVRSSDATLTGARWWHLLGSLAIGTVLGLLFYALAMFGVIASIPKLSIPLGQLPTTNELAALVLGFFGGFYARAWLPSPGTQTEAEPRPTDHPAV